MTGVKKNAPKGARLNYIHFPYRNHPLLNHLYRDSLQCRSIPQPLQKSVPGEIYLIYQRLLPSHPEEEDARARVLRRQLLQLLRSNKKSAAIILSEEDDDDPEPIMVSPKKRARK